MNFMGKSIASPDGIVVDDFFEPSVSDVAYEAVLHAGFLRTLMMPRFMEVLLEEPWYIRRQFIDAAKVIFEKTEVDMLSIKGAVMIAKKAGYL